MGWTVVTINEEDVRKLLHYQLETKFERVFTAAKHVTAAAMFRGRRSDEGEQRFYFSPAASEILLENAADAVFTFVDCEAPAREEVTFVAGDASVCLELHGRERAPR